MLPKSQRLNLKADFKRVAAGKKLTSPYLTLFVKPGSQSLKIGIAASTKNFKKAYQRNRARRLIASAFQPIYADLSQDLEIIALPKQAITSVKSNTVAEDLKKLLKEYLR